MEAIGNALDVSIHIPLNITMIRLIEWMIEPAYRKISPSKYFQNYSNSINSYINYDENTSVT